MATSPASSSSWRISTLESKGIVWASFVGPTSSDEIRPFLAALTAALPTSRATLIFDLRGLEGYNPEIKEPVKAWLSQHKLCIEEVIVVVPRVRVILRMVTAAVAVAVGIKIRTEETLEDLEPFTRPSP
jgi:hypothetical protein